MGKRNTRGRVVEAAVRLFNEGGTAAVSTNHVAEEAGISPGNLYYHFRNKEEIVREILKRMFVAWGEVWVLPDDRPLGVGDVRELLRRNFELQWRYRFFYREQIALLRRDPELARNYREIQRERLGEQELFMRGFVGAGVMREPEDPETLPALVRAGWIVATNWLSFLEAGGHEVGEDQMEEGADVILQFFRPYLSVEALRELDPARTKTQKRG
jgi:AcrR family transcriptional regulator